MKKVLIIEDDKSHSDVLEKLIKKENFEASVAFDGVSGLEEVEKLNPDFIILDLLLPRLDGMGVLHKLRQNPKYKSVKILILTNLMDEEKKKEALDLGVLDFLIKSDCPISNVAKRVKELI